MVAVDEDQLYICHLYFESTSLAILIAPYSAPEAAWLSMVAMVSLINAKSVPSRRCQHAKFKICGEKGCLARA